MAAKPNSWSWKLLLAGLGVCCVSLLTSLLTGQRSPYVPSAGALLAGAGLALRSHFPVENLYPRLTRFALAGSLIAFALGISGIFCWVCFDQEPFKFGPGLAFLLWIFFVPMALQGARNVLRNEEPTTDVAAQCATLGLAGVVASLAFPEDWFTIQRFWLVGGFLSCVAAALWAATRPTRQLVLSGVILYHFLGLISATLSAQPGPWIGAQLWTRFYRPYLEFFNINNAYRFYSPEPGPANHYWFHVIFKSGPAPDDLQAMWFKLPETDDQFQSLQTVGLQYQRLLAFAQNAETYEPPEPAELPWAVFERTYNSPGKKEAWSENLKDLEKKPRWMMAVPFHPTMPLDQQYRKPTHSSMIFCESFCRHLGHVAKYPEHPDWPIERIRVYRVLHLLGSYPHFADPQIPRSPNDPESYFPYYYGDFNIHGERFEDADPFLYWLLPIMRDSKPGQVPARDALIRNFCFAHAGDPRWVKKGPDEPWRQP